MYHGVLRIYKEKGYTSHDVVGKLRGILKQKKIGHTGTLDPDAEGVLPVCLGSATKLCDMLTDSDKTYETICKLGIETDTQDLSGTVLKTSDTGFVTEEQIRSAIREFIGDYEQVPPMYSALKVNGKKLYEYAREGIEIERITTDAKNKTNSTFKGTFACHSDIEYSTTKLPYAIFIRKAEGWTAVAAGEATA